MSRQIKDIVSDMPIIILTALTDTVALKQAIDIGIDSFLNKPLDDLDILFSKLDLIIKKIDYEKVTSEKEKTDLILDMVKNLSHHWRQPLSAISAISSGICLKFENNIPLNQSDIDNLAKITDQTEVLSDMLTKIEQLDFDNADINDIKKITYISNKI
jgi:YesN/AraC family two-component response regulator